jgi:hypothetical protein
VLLTIDPGKFHVGAALFYLEGPAAKQLAWADHLKSASKNPARAVGDVAAQVHESVGHGVTLTCCELMNVRRQRAQKGDPNDLLYCMMMNGAIFDRIGPNAELVDVSMWKGSVPKDIMGERIKSKLSAAELALLGTKPNHNVVDAVGIGLWKLQRL